MNVDRTYEFYSLLHPSPRSFFLGFSFFLFQVLCFAAIELIFRGLRCTGGREDETRKGKPKNERNFERERKRERERERKKTTEKRKEEEKKREKKKRRGKSQGAEEMIGGGLDQ